MKALLTIAFLVAACSLHGADKGRAPELIAAVFSGDEKAVRRLLDEGANPNLVFADTTPLQLAAEKGRAQLAELLIARGAKIDARDVGGDSPLAWAAANGHDDVVRLLVDKGADVNSRSAKSMTPLH